MTHINILEQALKAQRGYKCSSAFFLDLAAREGWVANARPWPLYPRVRDLVPNLEEAEWTPPGFSP